MKRENLTKIKVRALLKKMGWWYFMPPGNGYGRSGIPDFIICVGGRMVGIEAKSEKGKLTPHQVREIRSIVAAGGAMYIARVMDGNLVLKGLKNDDDILEQA